MWHEWDIIECLLSERESWDPPISVKRLLMWKIKPLCSTYFVCLTITHLVCSQTTYMTNERHERNWVSSVWIMGTEDGVLFLPLPQISHTMGFSPMSPWHRPDAWYHSLVTASSHEKCAPALILHYKTHATENVQNLNSRSDGSLMFTSSPIVQWYYLLHNTGSVPPPCVSH